MNEKTPLFRQVLQATVCGIAVAGALLASSCRQSSAPAEIEPAPVPSASVLSAIDRYLRETIAPNYGGDWEHCIPLVRIVATDDSNPADIRAWGAFNVFNYHLDGETLLCVSGGEHPGLMHLVEKDGTYAVTAFDPVLDGSEYLPSAKRIFGEHFAAWQGLVANEAATSEARSRGVAEYVSTHGLSAKFYQDFGWDPIPISPPPGP